MFPASTRFPVQSGECSRQLADFRGRPANVHGSWPISAAGRRMFTAVGRFSVEVRRMFTAVGRFPGKSGECSRQLADFPGSPANVRGSWPISRAVRRMFTAARRFPWKSGGCHGSSPTFTAVRRLALQASGFLCKPAAFRAGCIACEDRSEGDVTLTLAPQARSGVRTPCGRCLSRKVDDRFPLAARRLPLARPNLPHPEP
jgi:hypothetical protein